MTSDEIKTLAESISVPVEHDGGKVFYFETFECGEDDEPHDIAWAKYCDTNEQLEKIGLHIVDSWSDNDSTGGEIVEMKS